MYAKYPKFNASETAKKKSHGTIFLQFCMRNVLNGTKSSFVTKKINLHYAKNKETKKLTNVLAKGRIKCNFIQNILIFIIIINLKAHSSLIAPTLLLDYVICFVYTADSPSIAKHG